MIQWNGAKSWDLGDQWVLAQGPTSFPASTKEQFVLVDPYGQALVLKGFTKRQAMEEAKLRMEKQARWCEDLLDKINEWKLTSN